MTSKVAQSAIAEILPVPPTPRVIDLTLNVGALGSHAEPNVPCQFFRYWSRRGTVDVAGFTMSRSRHP